MSTRHSTSSHTSNLNNTREKESNFVFGTQYYRAPTPLPDEWEYDFPRIKEMGLNTVQIRVQWRQNEMREDCYTFDDIDRFFDLAAKHGLKVIFKFLLETAPDYIFEKHNANRVGLDGQIIRYGAHGAFYVGGWLPCFDNPALLERAEKFVSVMIERYKNRPELLLWNVWNEPRSKPIGECCCSHSIASYRNFLRERFDTIEALNSTYKKCWESFDTVYPPAMPHDYAELYLWRQWSWQAVNNRLAFITHKVRELDSDHQVISHVGGCSVIQDAAGDGSDDHLNATLVDFYGTSLPIPECFDNAIDRAAPFFICDWMRSVSERFWVYELYPEWGDWGPRTEVADYRFKVESCLASGSKGILFWQYRAERLGMENDLAGLVNIDGSFKAISHETTKIAAWVKENADFLSSSKVVCDPVGILYSRQSDLISRIESTGVNAPTLRDFELRGSYTYKFTLQGAHSLFHELGYTPKMVDDRYLAEILPSLKVLYLPEYYIVTQEAEAELQAFVARGGMLIAEEGIALRDEQTWLHYPWPGGNFRELFGVTVTNRFATKKLRKKQLKTAKDLPLGDYLTYLKPAPETEVLLTDQADQALITRKNNCIFIGTDLGMAFFRDHASRGEECLQLLSSLMPFPSPDGYTPGVTIRRQQNKDEVMFWIFNRSASLYERIVDEISVSVPPGETAVYRYSSKKNHKI